VASVVPLRGRAPAFYMSPGEIVFTVFVAGLLIAGMFWIWSKRRTSGLVAKLLMSFPLVLTWCAFGMICVMFAGGS
jgi:hypothetical protein